MDSVVRSKKKAAEEELAEHPHIADMADRQREAAKLAQREGFSNPLKRHLQRRKL